MNYYLFKRVGNREKQKMIMMGIGIRREVWEITRERYPKDIITYKIEYLD